MHLCAQTDKRTSSTDVSGPGIRVPKEGRVATQEDVHHGLAFGLFRFKE